MTASPLYHRRVAIVGTREPSGDLESRVIRTVQVLAKSRDDIVIVTGCCPTGVDHYVREACKRNGIRLAVCYAHWDYHGKAAGPHRNDAVVALVDAVIAFPSPRSRGTYDVIRKARDAGLDVRVEPVLVDT